MPNIGDKQKDKYWSGENYGWQSKATHDKLKQEGKFRAGTQEIDRVVSSGMNWATQNLPGVVSAVSSGLQTVGSAVTFTAQKIKESSPVGEAVVKGVGSALDLYDQGVEFVSEKTNIDKRLVGLAGDVAIGAATSGAFTAAYKSVGSAKAVNGGVRFISNINDAADGLKLYSGIPLPTNIRRTRVGQAFPEVAESASKYMDEAETYLKQQGSLKGYQRFTDPEGKDYLVRPRGTNPDGTTRLAMSPMSVKQKYSNVRRGRDVTSDEFEAFQRQQFNQMVKQTKSDTMVQFADMPSYVEHNRRLSSPYWKTARGKGQKAGDVDNLSQLFDLDFKTFKDNVDKALDRISDSPIDAYYDPLVDSIVVENIKTGKQLGYLDQSKPIKQQLEQFMRKAAN